MDHRYRTLSVSLVMLLIAVGCEADDDAQIDEDLQAAEESEEIDEDEQEVEELEEIADEEEGDAAELFDLPDVSTPDEGIVTAAQPSKEQFQALDQTQVARVVNLREDDEDGFWDGSEYAEELGIEYARISVEPGEGFTRENAEQLHEILADDVDGKTLVHCGTSERTAALLALRAHWLLDMEADEAMELGREAGLDELKDEVRQRIDG